ncbi:unnamed protein product, partial [Phaeothamnion confervicola]
GPASVDVRDSADAWIRIDLEAGEGVLIGSTCYHCLPEPASIIFCTPAAADGSREADNPSLPRPEPPPEPENSMRQLIVDLCKQFYHLGWVTGTGGSISVRHGDRVYMTPSGVQKERMEAKDLFVLDVAGNVLARPASGLRLSQCAPLFQCAYRQRNAGAVLHSHGSNCVLATLLCEQAGTSEFRIQHQEMIKGLAGHGYHDELVVPVIDNTAHERDLADSLSVAIDAYPNSNAVLVRRHGVYVWGKDWGHAKTQSECLHYLLEMAVEMRRLGIDAAAPPLGGCSGCG